MLRQPVEINAAAQVVNNTHPRFVFLFSILPTFDTVIPRKRILSFFRKSFPFDPQIRKAFAIRRNTDRVVGTLRSRFGRCQCQLAECRTICVTELCFTVAFGAGRLLLRLLWLESPGRHEREKIARGPRLPEASRCHLPLLPSYPCRTNKMLERTNDCRNRGRINSVRLPLWFPSLHRGPANCWNLAGRYRSPGLLRGLR